MALDLKQLESKPWYWGLGIGLGIAVLLYLAVTFYVPPNFNEMRDTIARKKSEIAALEEKINQGRAAERRLPQLREEVRRIELDLQRLLQIPRAVGVKTRIGGISLRSLRGGQHDIIQQQFRAEFVMGWHQDHGVGVI